MVKNKQGTTMAQACYKQEKLLPEHQCHCLQSSEFYIAIDWKAAIQ